MPTNARPGRCHAETASRWEVQAAQLAEEMLVACFCMYEVVSPAPSRLVLYVIMRLECGTAPRAGLALEVVVAD
jgi:hypothetical protein